MRFHDSNLPHAQNQDCRARATPLRPRQTPIPTISCTTNSCHASQMPSKPRPVEFYPLIILSVVASEASRVRATFGICRYPSPLGSIGIFDLARNSSQIRHNKELRGQNPENKGLTSVVFSGACAPSALTMMGYLRIDRKVRCHNEAVEKIGFSSPRGREAQRKSNIVRQINSCLDM